jgi:hypothetical protein
VRILNCLSITHCISAVLVYVRLVQGFNVRGVLHLPISSLPGVVFARARFPSSALVVEGNVQCTVVHALALTEEGIKERCAASPPGCMYRPNGSAPGLENPASAVIFKTSNWPNGEFGGAASPGNKRQAWRGSEEQFPRAGIRLDNNLNLRGGLRMPPGGTMQAFREVRVVVGLVFDLDGDTI